MGRGPVPPLRALPRLFVVGAELEAGTFFELPKAEYDKFHKVLRLRVGEEVALLPNDGTVWRCALQGRGVVPTDSAVVDTEAKLSVTLLQAMPKADKLEEVVRLATEMGVAKFVLFPSERTVLRWSADKLHDRLDRLGRIAMEAAEVAFRTRLPQIVYQPTMAAVLEAFPTAIVLSEVDRIERTLEAELAARKGPVELMIGPEGGWAPPEVAQIGERAVTLGPRVLRVDTAAAAACALALFGPSRE